MNERTRNNWFMAATMTVTTLVVVLMVVSVLVGASGPDPSHTGAPASSVGVAPVKVSEAKQAITAVTVHSANSMLQQHQPMMDQMRASLSTTMNELMTRDPMWRVMRSSAFTPGFEEHEQDINRMLARDG